MRRAGIISSLSNLLAVDPHVVLYATTPAPLAVTLQVVSIVLFTFIGYLNIGIPLAVLPGYVHSDLGFGAVIAGLVISVQYLATLLSRPYAGKIIDNQGSKRAVMIGLAGCGLSGVFMLISAWTPNLPMLSLISLLIGRLVLAARKAWSAPVRSAGASAALARRTPPKSSPGTASPVMARWRSARRSGCCWSASWGCGAWASASFCWPRWACCWPGRKPPRRSWPASVCRSCMCSVASSPRLRTGLGSIGFGTIATFITLYYATRHWDNAVLCLSLFGASFIGARLLFGNLINRLGGFRVAIACLSVETWACCCCGWRRTHTGRWPARR
jgi:MFS family permease